MEEKLEEIAESKPKIKKEIIKILKEQYCKDPADNTDYPDDHSSTTYYDELIIDENTELEPFPFEGEISKKAYKEGNIAYYSLENTECSPELSRRGYDPWMFERGVFLIHSEVKDQWVAICHKLIENGRYENKGPYSLNGQAKEQLDQSPNNPRPPYSISVHNLRIIVET